MSNRCSSTWWCRNKKAKDVLIDFVNKWNMCAFVGEEDLVVYISRDNYVYEHIVEDLPLVDYVHSRSDEFMNFYYYAFGDFIIDSESKNHHAKHQFDQWICFKYKDKYISQKRLMQMKDDYFSNKWVKYEDEFTEYCKIENHNDKEWILAKKFLTDESYFKWLSEQNE